MTELSRPHDGILGGDAGPYSALQWQELQRYAIGYNGDGGGQLNSVLLGSGTSARRPLAVYPTSPISANVNIATGAALVMGEFYINDAVVQKSIAANTSSNPRIDTVVLRYDYLAHTVRITVKQGTAAVSPSRPALTQTANVLWEVPLADITVASGFATLGAGDIFNYPTPANLCATLGFDNTLNNSGGELRTGDVVVFDSSVTNAAKTTTQAASLDVMGVWVGLTANGGVGRVMSQGVGYVYASAAVTRGQRLSSHSTAKQAAISDLAPFAIALETTAGAGLVLCWIDASHVAARARLSGRRMMAKLRDEKPAGTDAGTFTAAADRTRDLNTVAYNPAGLVTLSANQINFNRLGQYYIWARVPGYSVENHKAKLRNVTQNVDAVIGSIAFCDFATSSTSPAQTDSIIDGPITVTSLTDKYEIWHFCNHTKSNDGFGNASNAGGTVEVYTEIKIEWMGE